MGDAPGRARVSLGVGTATNSLHWPNYARVRAFHAFHSPDLPQSARQGGLIGPLDKDHNVRRPGQEVNRFDPRNRVQGSVE